MRLALLGPLVIFGDSGQQASPAAPRLRGLPAALLPRANTPVLADVLAEAVWDSEPPPAGAARLRLEPGVGCRERGAEPVA